MAEWVEWNAKGMTPNGIVDVKFRDGRVLHNTPAIECYWRWNSGSPYDIVAYKQVGAHWLDGPFRGGAHAGV